MPLSEADLIFPSQAATGNINKLLGDLKKSHLSILNRLRSIRADADFVEAVVDALSSPSRPDSPANTDRVNGLDPDPDHDETHESLGSSNTADSAARLMCKAPKRRFHLIANERCGSWYIPPHRKDGFAYFKSTDGHFGEWRFSTRRLNLHLLDLFAQVSIHAEQQEGGGDAKPDITVNGEDGHVGGKPLPDGLIVVDSTRRGKLMPDALSKTIPMWCCVLNRAMFPDTPELHELYTPPQVVSPSEHAQMLLRVPVGVASFLALGFNTVKLREKLGGKPLRPMWVHPGTDLESSSQLDLGTVHPVICCTASRRVAGGEVTGHEGGYIQGAGDDTENWALGLTSDVFWRNEGVLLGADEEDLPALIVRLVEESNASSLILDSGQRHLVNGATSLGRCIAVTSLLAADSELDNTCCIKLTSDKTAKETWFKSPRVLELGLGKSKIASRQLRDALGTIFDFVCAFIHRQNFESDNSTSISPQIVIACETGKDLSIGVALMLLCCLFEDEDGIQLRKSVLDATGDMQQVSDLNKDMIRVRLSRIMMAMPEANPSRATLQSVNSFLMDRRYDGG